MRQLSSLRVFKTNVQIGTYDDILGLSADAIKNEQRLCIDTSNTVVVSLAAINNRFNKALSSFDVVLPDSRPLVWYMNLLGAGLADTCYGPETALRVWQTFAGEKRMMIIGGDEKTKSVFETGFHPPAKWITQKLDPNDRERMQWLVKEIEAAAPDIIFLGLGCPKSYYVLERIKTSIAKGVVIHVGGSFDIISGVKPMTSVRIQRLGLGWLFRLVHEPGRLWKRYVIFNTLFVLCSMIFYLDDLNEARKRRSKDNKRSISV